MGSMGNGRVGVLSWEGPLVCVLPVVNIFQGG